jgi:hypothetical protein
MGENTQQDIRRLLKTFGIQADEAIQAYLERAPGEGPLRLRLSLEDTTDYSAQHPSDPLRLEIEGQISR